MITSLQEQPVLQALVFALLVALTVFVVVRTWNAVAEHRFIGKPEMARDLIMISGEGKVSAKPTLARVQFGVVTQTATAAQAQADNTKKMNAVIAALQQLGIDKKDLETSGYYLNPVYDYSKSPMQVQGYSLTQNLQVKIRDFDKVPTVLAKGVELGINQVNDVAFTIDDPKVLQDEARMKALEDAKKKAEKLADALGVDLVRVTSFTESPVGAPSPMPTYYRDAAVSAVETGGASPNIQSGEQDVQMVVSVTYEIR